MSITFPFRLSVLLLLSLGTCLQVANSAEKPYRSQIEASKPAYHWSFEGATGKKITSTGSEAPVDAAVKGDVKFSVAGPRTEAYPDFEPDNQAAQFNGGKSYLQIKDRAGKSGLKFSNGDQMTIEAWLQMGSGIEKSYPYIVGKGRTKQPGFPANDQNYSLRLDTRNGAANLSFLFFTEGMLKGKTVSEAGHRWTSTASVPLDGDWHHVAIVYEFGKPKSIQGYIDGEPTNGTWDLAGETTNPPVVNDNDVWIGSSMGGTNSFKGSLDEIAIHRRLVSADELKQRFSHNAVDHFKIALEEELRTAPADHVRYTIFEGIDQSRSWNVNPREGQLLWEADSFAITELPRKYNERGIIVDRKLPALIMATSEVQIPSGQYELVLRCLNSTKIFVDGKLLDKETPFMGLSSSAHGTMHALQEPLPGEVMCPTAHHEERIQWESDGNPHVITMMTIAGHKSLPGEVGEWTLAIRNDKENTYLVGPELKWSYDDASWVAFTEEERNRLIEWNANLRHELSEEERSYWKRRHEAAQEWIAKQQVPAPPEAKAGESHHPIDRFINTLLSENKFEPTSKIDDWSFLRRATLDLIGRNPNSEEVKQFWNDPVDMRREYLVDRLLQHPEWADHWIPYWQDVLAENPGLTKPNLNNSGPFRWYLHEAFQDNRSLDRIVSELVLMDGSRWHGGTAGFGVASNNDVPMAAKAHIIGTAFLGVEMKCARCHDAPYHESIQRDLFNVAAMLNRGPVAVPNSSSIIATPEQLASMPVKVTLKPGEKVAPAWPFEELIPQQSVEAQEFLRSPDNTRDVLALLLTNPENERFSQVMVNRIWKRFLGMGIVEPAEDWETGDAIQPELLEWLSAEFVSSGYDLKEITRLIMTSDLYQRQALSGEYERRRHFAGPTRRLLTGEQVVDTIYSSVGKDLPSERLTYNADGRQSGQNFVDFGIPRKAWELVAISNERERPSMNLPKAQSVVDLLSSYHWRSERQDPITDRDKTVTPLQPIALANGTALNRAVDVSDNGNIVELCLTANSEEALVKSLFQRILTRDPTQEEIQQFSSFLAEGFETRKVPGAQPAPVKVERSPLTWTAHFDPDASLEGIRQQEVAEKGDPPTQQLASAWRERVEDVVWTLFNAPEFVFVP